MEAHLRLSRRSYEHYMRIGLIENSLLNHRTRSRAIHFVADKMAMDALCYAWKDSR
jgi:hypothetical protein